MIIEENKKEVKNTSKKVFLFVIVGIIILGSLAFSIASYYNTKDAEWICLANKCINYVQGDDLVKKICSLKGNEMICEFKLNNQDYKINLNNLDVKSLESIKDVQIFEDGCGQWKCSTQIFMKGGEI